jgi:hypothetical protein
MNSGASGERHRPVHEASKRRPTLQSQSGVIKHVNL